MAKKNFIEATPSNAINLVYIRAAIEHATGQRLPLEEIRTLLVEEGLITPSQAKKHAQPFRGYAEFYEGEEFSTSRESVTKDIYPNSLSYDPKGGKSNES